MPNQDKKIKMVDIVRHTDEKRENIIKIEPAKKEFFIKKAVDSVKEEKIKEEKSAEKVEIEYEIEKENIKEKKEWHIKKYLLMLGVLAILGGSVYAAIEILPKVEIKIIGKKSVFELKDWITMSKNIGGIDLVNKQIPAAVFSDKKNLTLSFPADGRKQVERKASGKVLIYNSFSSDSQALIKGTRLESPDGKIFKLDDKVVVPGAKISDGKIIASSIEANVTAENTGEKYNIGPVSRFAIPGFKGTPKYDTFYASSKEAMAGGFVGEVAYPTEENIKSAREKIETALKESLEVLISSQISRDFKVIDGGKKFAVIKENIDKEADQAGNFSVFLEGEYSIFAFKEADLLELIKNLARRSLGQDNFEAKEYKLDYGASIADFQNNKLSFNVDYSGIFWQPINIMDFKKSVLNKQESELKQFVFSLTGVEKATISFWPFWVKKVPNKIERVEAVVE